MSLPIEIRIHEVAFALNNKSRVIIRLQFATSAKHIKNKPIVNETMSDRALMKRMQQEIAKLKQELERVTSCTIHLVIFLQQIFVLHSVKAEFRFVLSSLIVVWCWGCWDGEDFLLKRVDVNCLPTQHNEMYGLTCRTHQATHSRWP